MQRMQTYIYDAPFRDATNPDPAKKRTARTARTARKTKRT